MSKKVNSDYYAEMSYEPYVSSYETTDHVARKLGVTMRTVQRWAKKGVLEAEKVLINNQKRWLIEQ